MKKLVITIMFFALIKFGFGQDSLQLQDFNGFRVEATEILLNGDTIESIDPSSGQIMKFDGNKWAKGNESDPRYAADSTLIKAGLRDAVPYTGAIKDVNLGANSIIADSVGVGTSKPTAKIDIKTDAVGTTFVDNNGLALTNTTAATAGVQQYPPSIHWKGSGYDNTAQLSKSVDWIAYANATAYTGNPTSGLIFASSINGSAYTTRTTISSSGTLTVAAISTTSAITLSRSSIATSSYTGLTLQSASAATAVIPERYSPAQVYVARAWCTTPTAASNTINFKSEVRPVSGATTTGSLIWSFDNNGGGYSDVFTIQGGGKIGVGITEPTEKLEVNGDIKGDSIKGKLANEADPRYATDSSLIKTGVRSWNASLAKTITTADTTRWSINKYDVTVTNDVTSYNLPFALKTNAMIFYNGYLLDPNRWAGVNSSTLLLYIEPKTYDTLQIFN